MSFSIETIKEYSGRGFKCALFDFDGTISLIPVSYTHLEHKQKKLRHGGKIYLISPWALTWDDDNYYMIGYDSDENKIKHYRVDKMTKIQPTEEKRDGAEFFADFDMALYSKQTFGMYGVREETVAPLRKQACNCLLYTSLSRLICELVERL